MILTQCWHHWLSMIPGSQICRYSHNLYYALGPYLPTITWSHLRTIFTRSEVVKRHCRQPLHKKVLQVRIYWLVSKNITCWNRIKIAGSYIARNTPFQECIHHYPLLNCWKFYKVWLISIICSSFPFCWRIHAHPEIQRWKFARPEVYSAAIILVWLRSEEN
jgi:hypothetical protein